MKVLILSSNTGEGHNSAAAAVATKLVAKGHSCDVKDALGYISGGMSDFICGWHVRLYRKAPKVFDLGYRVVEKTQNSKLGAVLASFLNKGAKNLAKDIEESGYDWVLSTHPFSAYMFTVAVKKHGVKVKSGFIATDYTCSPPVELTCMDLYFIPHKDVAADFTDKGIPKYKIVPSGLPVREEFYKSYKKDAAKRALGLPQDKQNILLMCGSMGCGPLKEITKRLSVTMPDHAHLTVICGSNAKLKRELKALRYPRNNVRIVGYTNHINYYMDSAELIISKAGGITCTESMVKRLPMVLINAVGGCETYNRTFFISRGGAVETSGKITDLALQLLKNPKRLDSMAEAMAATCPGNAAENICEYICKE